MIAGLGNPGSAYTGTRHNIGFRLVELLASHMEAAWQSDSRFNGSLAKGVAQNRPLWLVKPLTFMNASGTCLGPLSQFYKIPPEALLVIYDDITLSPGAVKLTVGGSDGGHNGVTSLLRHLPNTFQRLRIGIGPKRHPEQDLADHVLGKMTAEEELLFSEKLSFYIQGIETWLARGTAIAQNFINKKTSP